MKKIFEKLNRFFNGSLQIAVLDLKKGRWFVELKDSCIPYLKAENAKGNHIVIRPLPKSESFYMLVDDVEIHLLRYHHKQSDDKWRAGRLVVETSPGNFQVWIRSSRPLELDVKRYWLKNLHNDPGADPNHRWGRCPGFRNRKEKHRDDHGGYPLARLIWVDWQYKAAIPSANILTETATSLPPLPRGEVCHLKNIARHDYDRADESATDFSYTLALARRHFSDEYIKNCLINERQNWQNHQGKKRMNDYIERTIAKARVILSNSTE